MLSSSTQSIAPQYITVRRTDVRSEKFEFGKSQDAEAIMGALIVQHATEGTHKNFLKADKSYDVIFKGKSLKVSVPQDVFIISRKTPKSNELSLSIRFFTNKVLGKGAFGQVRELAEKKCHIRFDSNKEPVAVFSNVHHRKVVKEVKVSDEQDIKKLAKENKIFGLIHDATGRGESRKEIYTDLDFDPQQSVSRMVMARFEGKTLDEVVTENLSMDERWGIAIGFAKQLKKVHDNGYIVVDLKLENIMHSRKDQETRIIDVAFVPHGYSKSAMTVTPYIASPEIMNNAIKNASIPLDYSSDIYSLAIVMISVFSGLRYEKGLLPILRQHIKNDSWDYRGLFKTLIEISEGKHPGYGIQDFIKQIRTKNPGIPSELISLLLKMTNNDPTKRPTLMEVIVAMEVLKDPTEALNALTDQVRNLTVDVDKETKAQQELIKQLNIDFNAEQPKVDQLIDLKKSIDDLKQKAVIMAKSPLVPRQQRHICKEQSQLLVRMSESIEKTLVRIEQANAPINTAKIKSLTDQVRKLEEVTRQEIEKQQGMIQRSKSDFNAEQPKIDQLVNLKKQIDKFNKNIKTIVATPSIQKKQQQICHEKYKSLINLSGGIETAIADIQRANEIVNIATETKLKSLTDQVRKLENIAHQEAEKQQGLVRHLKSDFNAEQPKADQLINLKKPINELKGKIALMAKSPLVSKQQQQICQERYDSLTDLSGGIEVAVANIQQANIAANTAKTANATKLKALTDQVDKLKMNIDKEIGSQQKLIEQLNTDFNAEQPKADQLINLKKPINELKEKIALMAESPLASKQQQQICRERYESLTDLFGGIEATIVSMKQANDIANTAKLGQEIKIGYDFYVQLTGNSSKNFLPQGQRKEVLDWCARVKDLTKDNPVYKKIAESVSSIEVTLKSTHYSSGFFESKSNRSSNYLAFLSKLKSFFETIHFNYPKFREDVKAYEEKREIARVLGEVPNKAPAEFKPQ
jgi:serine/threonine protein kinase